MHLNDRMLETHLSTPISQTFALIAGDCNTTAFRTLQDRQQTGKRSARPTSTAVCAGLSKIPYDFGKATASPTGSKT
jgi:hypothetical protein